MLQVHVARSFVVSLSGMDKWIGEGEREERKGARGASVGGRRESEFCGGQDLEGILTVSRWRKATSWLLVTLA